MATDFAEKRGHEAWSLPPHALMPSPYAEDCVDEKPSRHAEQEPARKRTRSKWRYGMGMMLLLITVFLWTASDFLVSTIFADKTFNNPFFVTYTNSTFFMLPLIPILLRKWQRNPGEFLEVRDWIMNLNGGKYLRLQMVNADDSDTFIDPNKMDSSHDGFEPASLSFGADIEEGLGSGQSQRLSERPASPTKTEQLNLLETAKLSFEFFLLWFGANYFTAACLEYTTVASATILTSTSSIWTLLVGSIVGVEKFTLTKLCGVFASIVGIVLISTVDISGKTDQHRGNFPHKTQFQIAVGDSMAFVSAALFGVYAVLIKKRMGDESRVNMPLFFGLVGLMNVVLLWPGFIILHLTGIERFDVPPSGHVLTIVLTNSTVFLILDFCWAYSMLLTSPLVTTVGLSMTIPLSLIGQMVLENQYATATYWLGAGIGLLSFIFVNREEVNGEKDEDEQVMGKDEKHGDRISSENVHAFNGR